MGGETVLLGQLQGFLECFGLLEAVAWSFGQGFFEHSVKGGWNGRVDYGRVGWGGGENIVGHGLGPFAYKGFGPGEQFVQDDPGCEQVGARIGTLSHDLFGCHIAVGASHFVHGGGRCVGETGGPEIGDFDSSICQYNQVGWFDVTMDNPLGVDVSQSIESL